MDDGTAARRNVAGRCALADRGGCRHWDRAIASANSVWCGDRADARAHAAALASAVSLPALLRASRAAVLSARGTAVGIALGAAWRPRLGSDHPARLPGGERHSLRVVLSHRPRSVPRCDALDARRA